MADLSTYSDQDLLAMRDRLSKSSTRLSKYSTDELLRMRAAKQAAVAPAPSGPVVPDTTPPPSISGEPTGSLPTRLFRPVGQGIKTLARLAGAWGEATDQDLKQTVLDPMIADERQMGPSPMRGVSEAARTAIGAGQFFTTGMAKFADQMINPEAQGLSTVGAVKEAGRGIIQGGQGLLPQGGELYRHVVQNVTGTQNPPEWLNAPANLADKAAGLMMTPEEIAAAKEQVNQDPFTPFGTGMILAGGLKGAAKVGGLARGLRRGSVVPEKAPAVPEPVVEKAATPVENIATPVEKITTQPASVVGAEPPAPVAPKQAWEMTKEEYRQSRQAELQSYKAPTPNGINDLRGIAKSSEYLRQKEYFKNWRDDHRQSINVAIKQGKPVPASVLADYPDLAPKAAPVVDKGAITKGMSVYAKPSQFPNPKRAKIVSVVEGPDGKPTAYQVKVQGSVYNVTPDQVQIPQRTIGIREYQQQFSGMSMAERRQIESSAKEFDNLLMENANKFLPPKVSDWPSEFQDLASSVGKKDQSMNYAAAVKYLRTQISDKLGIDVSTPIGRSQAIEQLRGILGSEETFVSPESVPEDWVATPFRKAGVGEMPKAMESGGAKPTTINDIRQLFERDLQTPIRTGKYAGQGGRGAVGIYKNKADVIRLKDYGDIESLSHEVAHAIDNKTGIKAIYNRFKDELGPLDYEPTKARASEGFAEYLRHYLTGSGDAKALAPKFTQAFEQFLNDNPNLKRTIENGKQLFDSWRSQGAEARVKAAIATKPSRGPIKDVFRNIKNAYLRKMFDVLTPIRHYTEAAEKAAGRKLRGEENPFDLATALKNKSSARAENWVTRETVDFDGRVTGESLSTILSKVKGNEEKAIEYAYAKHGIERWKQGKNPGSDLRDLEYFVEKNKSPEFEQFSKDVSAYRDRLLQYVVDAGGIDAKTAKVFREIYQSSIPLYREGFETGPGGGGGTKYINANQPIKKAHGSGRIVVNPLAGLMKETSRLIKFADERRVGNSIIEASEKFPGLGSWIEKVDLGSKATHLNVEQAIKNFKEAGIDLSDMNPDELANILTTWGRNTKGIPAENIITRFKDGKVEAYQVSPELMEGLSGLNTSQVEGVLRYLTYPKKAIAAGATALRASFSLVTNPLRDPWSAMMQSRIWKTTPLQSVGGMFRVALHKLGVDSKIGLDPSKHDLMRRVGVEQAQFFNSELPKAMENAKRLIADNNRSRAMNVIRHPIDLYRAVLNTPEAGPRSAEFVSVYDRVLKETGNERTAWIEATNAYQDVTMNFSRSGSWGAKINQFLPFFNPALQEPGLIARSFRRAPVATTVKGIGLMTIPTVALWLENKDQDWYKATPTWEKATFWLFRAGDKTIRIPKPFLWGAMFASFPEATLDAIYQKDPQTAIDMAKQIAENTIPNPLTAAASPFGAAIGEGGYDFFRNRSIVPQSQVENLPPSERFGRYTTETAKKIGGVLDVSPTKVDYTIGAFTGGLGTDIIQGIEKPFTDKAEKTGIENDPIIGRLISRSPYLGKFYDEANKLSDKEKEIKIKPVAERTKEDFATLDKAKYYEDVAKEMSAIRKQISVIDKADKPGELKSIEIDRLNKQMDDLAHKTLYGPRPAQEPKKPHMSVPKIPRPRAEIYTPAELDMIPASLFVQVDSVGSKTGKRIKVRQNAREAIRELHSDLELYAKLREMAA